MRLYLWCMLIFVSGASWAAEEKTLMLGDRAVKFTVLHHQPNHGIVTISLHSNETTCRAVMRNMAKEIGGTYVELQAGGDRFLHLRPGKDKVMIDTNRMFTPAGVLADLRKRIRYREEDPKMILRLGEQIVSTFLSGSKAVVSVHNNTNGGYSIASYDRGGSESKATAKLHINEQQDPDNFFLVTHEADFKALAALHYNVVLQHSSPPDDGSLSVFAARKGIRYVNVEAEHGAAAIQKEMLRDLFQLLNRH